MVWIFQRKKSLKFSFIVSKDVIRGQGKADLYNRLKQFVDHYNKKKFISSGLLHPYSFVIRQFLKKGQFMKRSCY